MTRAVLAALVILTPLAWAAPAPEEAPGPPPILTRAHLQEGKVFIEVTAAVPKTVAEQRTVTVIENGVAVTRAYVVNVVVYQTETRLLPAGDDLMVFDTAGVRVAQDRLSALLKEPQQVLLSADGKPVSPQHLRQAKPSTLVFVLPSYKAPAAPAKGRPPESPLPPGVEKP